MENSAPGSSVATVSEPASASTSASDRWVQWSALAQSELDREPHAAARGELVGVDARAAARRAMPALSTARDWSTSKAPRSQNTSTQRAYGAQASSIAPVTSVDVVVGVGRRPA